MLPFESKPLFHPEVLRQQVRSFHLPDSARGWQPKLQHCADLIVSGRADEFNETDLLPDFLFDIFCGMLGYTRPAGAGETFTLSRECNVEVDGRGVETFYGLVKGRLSLVNFTGSTVESVFQDFYATLLIANLESVLCRQAQEELQAKRPRGGLLVTVNRAVSVNALKHQVIALLCRRDLPAELLIEKLREVFKCNPVKQRPGRQAPRVLENARRSLNFARFKRKMVF